MEISEQEFQSAVRQGEELRRNMIWGGDKDLDTASN